MSALYSICNKRIILKTLYPCVISQNFTCETILILQALTKRWSLPETEPIKNTFIKHLLLFNLLMFKQFMEIKLLTPVEPYLS